MSDEVMERRMLDTALAMVARSGLTVGLDHLSFEDIIREAGVPRTAVYRRWPYKDLFLSDLLRALAADARPYTEPADAGQEVLGDALAGQSDQLASAQGRHDLVTEMIRRTGASDLKAAADSVEWRTYLALQATCQSLPDGELRSDIQAALAAAEQDFIDRVAGNWERLAGLLGLRLRPGSGGSFELIATLASAALRGLVLMTLPDRDLADRRMTANPTGATNPADWSLLGMAAAAIAAAFLEPDPDVVWDESRLASVRDLLPAEIDRVAMVDPEVGTTGPSRDGEQPDDDRRGHERKDDTRD